MAPHAPARAAKNSASNDRPSLLVLDRHERDTYDRLFAGQLPAPGA